MQVIPWAVLPERCVLVYFFLAGDVILFAKVQRKYTRLTTDYASKVKSDQKLFFNQCLSKYHIKS